MKKLKILARGQSLILFLMMAFKKNSAQKNAEENSDNFTVSMTDNPGNYAGLQTEIKQVEAYSPASGWIILNSVPQVVDVLQLTNGKEILLGSKPNTDGMRYSKLKLVFGTKHRLTLKSEKYMGSNDKEKIHQMKFDGSREVTIDLGDNPSPSVLLDFNVAASVNKREDGYVLKPKISIIKDTKTGVKGKVIDVEGAVVFLSNGKDSISTYVDAEGNFLARGLEEGEYTVRVQQSGENEEYPALSVLTLTGVTVRKNEITDIGVI